MKIDYELRIYKKYFDAILQLKKSFELRQKPIPRNSIVKLTCIENGRYIIFKSGECREVRLEDGLITIKNNQDGKYDFLFEEQYDWFDKFCWDYINKKQTYLIEIAEIIEVK